METVSYFVLENGYHYEVESGGAVRERGRFATVGAPAPGEPFEIQHYPFPDESDGAPWRFETAQVIEDRLTLTSESGESRAYTRASRAGGVGRR